ncbi:TniQ family protein [Pseudomonas sp. SW-3]|uniref:TniQ family protein n=1 Tax=Pseudomonas sp. SW-3 TaxID=147212 RepID=UPI00190DC3ED|nr:TniQ family protein [Pseudomonas sp. SW-3]QQO01707.1 hypothetical protein JIO00_14510 [Pseudomonas sp. SW-3]
MRSRNLIRHMTKPLDDETLSSWLSRNATNPYVGNVHSEFLDSCQAMAKASLEGDVDRLCEHQGFLSCFSERDQEVLAITFKLPDNLIEVGGSLNYCPQCLADDIASMHAPAWRKGWRVRGNCFCAVHDELVLLQRLSVSGRGQFNRAWLAFSQHASTGEFIFGNHFIQRLISLPDTAAKEQKLCRIVLKVMRWIESAPEYPTYGRPSKQCLVFVLGFFLYRPFARCKGGIGQWFFSSVRSTAEISSQPFRPPSVRELSVGVKDSTPRNIALSYLFLGCAYNLLSEDDMEFINHALYFSNSPFPRRASELRALACCFQPGHIFQFKLSASRNLYAGDIAHLDWLFG